ncbi:histidine phosphatase family protein [Halotalea alkalilenta]|uniref:Phosphoglycerate mutase n=1 Tax=Halotalea alkalilenta TaxID=376489 RepID=A0A172YD12_9GAMM|nr:histidine phosphatase family protein [Halotalea alkalilenta]ANF57104.1 hypothetical protein A5892_06185 [Halotalea alkalilenta]
MNSPLHNIDSELDAVLDSLPPQADSHSQRGPRRIVLMRHGEPEARFDQRIPAAELRQWVARYHRAGLKSHSHCSDAQAVADDCVAVVCSDLPRAMESVQRLKRCDALVLSDPALREIEFPHGPGRWPTPALPPAAWLALFRVLWLFGYRGNAESLGEARRRARHGANTLAQLSERHDSVLFVGHAMFNVLVARSLLKQGWRGPRRPGSRHWRYAIYER